MVSFRAVLFLRDVLDENWDLNESVSEGFPTYSHSCLSFDFVPYFLDIYLE